MLARTGGGGLDVPMSDGAASMNNNPEHRLARRFLELLINHGSPEAAGALATPDFAATLVTGAPSIDPALAALDGLHATILDVSSRDRVVAVTSRYAGRRKPGIRREPSPAPLVHWVRTDLIELAGGKVADFKPGMAPAGLGQRQSSRASAVRVDHEPVLDTFEIQAHIIPGFGTTMSSLLFFRIDDTKNFRDWMGRLAGRVTTFGDLRDSPAGAAGGDTPPCLGFALSYQGLEQLTAEARKFRDLPFKQGMPRRSALLGDPRDPKSKGTCENWVVGGPGRVPDGLIVIGANSTQALERFERSIIQQGRRSVSFIHKDSCAKKPPAMSDHEHFGYLDDISQPGIRGRVAGAPAEFVTPRSDPGNPDEGLPGQHLVWPGEFVFGYNGQNATDKLAAGAYVGGGPEWARNGSFLVYRRLAQDVPLYHDFLERTSQELARGCAHLSGLTAEKLAAKLMGRWPDGSPLMRYPDEGSTEGGQDPARRNDFRYCHQRTAQAGAPDRSGGSVGGAVAVNDPLGAVCPFAAHIRRAYPRDDTSVGVSEANIETHRILRRGMPFGPWSGGPGDRGLVFLAYQTSIERQFEFIVRAWLNNPNAHRTYDGHDPIVGQNPESGAGRERCFKFPVKDPDGQVRSVKITMPDEWVTPTGGAYLFTPSIAAIRGLASGAIC